MAEKKEIDCVDCKHVGRKSDEYPCDRCTQETNHKDYYDKEKE